MLTTNTAFLDFRLLLPFDSANIIRENSFVKRFALKNFTYFL